MDLLVTPFLVSPRENAPIVTGVEVMEVLLPSPSTLVSSLTSYVRSQSMPTSSVSPPMTRPSSLSFSAQARLSSPRELV